MAGWYLLRAIYVVATPFLLAGSMAAYLNEAIQRQGQLDPNAAPPPADMLAILNNFMVVGFAIGAAIGVAISVVAIIGALQRWTWVFYAVMVLLAFETMSFPFAVFSAFTTSLSPIKLPVGLTAASIAFGAAGAALFIWMVVAIFRRGPWAMTRAPLS